MAEIELKTAPADFRFPTTNQTRHCFTRYIEFHSCILLFWGPGVGALVSVDLPLIDASLLGPGCVAAKGEESGECDKFAKYYRSLCPGEWIEKWNEQRDTGTFPGPL